MSVPDTLELGIIAVTDAEMAGAIVWWKLQGALPIERLEEAWDAAGLDSKLLPPNPRPSDCLVRALREHQSSRQLARPLGRSKGWVLVSEESSGDDLDYTTLVRARLDEDKNLVVDVEHPAGQEAANAMQMAFARYRGLLVTTDVSAWISHTLVPAARAVRLRKSGGIYFVPLDHVDAFRSWVGALRSASDHVVYEVPALKSDEAVEAILAALVAEADQELTAMEGELDTTEMGKRALKVRERRCDRMREKVETYEALLGQRMGDLQGRLEGLRASLVEAAFVDGGQEELL